MKGRIGFDSNSQLNVPYHAVQYNYNETVDQWTFVDIVTIYVEYNPYTGIFQSSNATAIAGALG